MRWLHSAVLTSASLIPLSTFADEPGIDELRGRVEQLERELQSDLGHLEKGREALRAMSVPEGRERGAYAMEEPGRPGPDRGRFEGEGMKRDGRGPDPVRPGGPGRDGAPQAPRMPGGGGPDSAEDQMFQLKMRAREIEHQMQNLKFELETVHLQMEHLGQKQRGGQDRPRAGGPDQEPRRHEGVQEPGRDRPNVENLERRAAELHAKAAELKKALQGAEESGDRERANELRNGLERLKNAFEEMHRNQEGGDRPKDRKDGPRADAEQNERRATLKARVDDLRRKLEKAEANGEEGNAKELRNAIEKLMHDLTGGEKENVERKRAEAMARIEARMAQVEEQMQEAKRNGRKEVSEKLRAELEELRAMAKKARGDQGGGEKKPEKRPRMI
ncbi:MAG: protein product from [Planctomycetota bacterium]|nr:MAG: protein product from [Planctomycetota bacterium]